MDSQSWNDQTIEEMLEFLDRNLSNALAARRRANGDAQALSKKMQTVNAHVERVSKDVHTLRQKLRIPKIV